jgi:hypothetical protein
MCGEYKHSAEPPISTVHRIYRKFEQQADAYSLDREPRRATSSGREALYGYE